MEHLHTNAIESLSMFLHMRRSVNFRFENVEKRSSTHRIYRALDLVIRNTTGGQTLSAHESHGSAWIQNHTPTEIDETFERNDNNKKL